MSEPKRIITGTRVEWNRPYAAGSSTASYQYVLLSDSGKVIINASYQHGQIRVNAVTAETRDYPSGHYIWSLVEERAGEKVVLATGRIMIAADPTAVSSAVVQSHSEKMLAAIRKRLEGRALSDHENYSIDGRSLSRIPIETLHSLENRYAWRVYREQVARGERTQHRAIKFR